MTHARDHWRGAKPLRHPQCRSGATCSPMRPMRPMREKLDRRCSDDSGGRGGRRRTGYWQRRNRAHQRRRLSSRRRRIWRGGEGRVGCRRSVRGRGRRRIGWWRRSGRRSVRGRGRRVGRRRRGRVGGRSARCGRRRTGGAGHESGPWGQRAVLRQGIGRGQISCRSRRGGALRRWRTTLSWIFCPGGLWQPACQQRRSEGKDPAPEMPWDSHESHAFA